MPKACMLLVVPDDDLSIELFLTEDCKAKMIADVIPYKKSFGLLNKAWDFIYIRGPFVKSDFDDSEIKNSVDKILNNRGNAYIVDDICEFEDLLLEDKWRQYKLFAEIMPKTQLVESFKNTSIKDQLVKKRISGRSRDIHFEMSNIPAGSAPDDYIIQKRLDIQIEYRAFMAGGELLLPLEIKSSKTETTKNQAIGIEAHAPQGVREICIEVSKKLKFDLMGLDIAKTAEGFYLLEVNRSPQFINYLKLSSMNLAENLFTFLLEKKS